MKKILIILIILFSTNSFSQKWSLNNVDKNKEFGFEYWFSFQNENDINEFEIIEKENLNKTELKGQIFDKLNNPISDASINIISKDKSINKELRADFDGNFKTELSNGEYSIEINYFGFDQFKTDLNIKENSSVEFKINLGLGQELRTYQIASKNELTENEISEIIKCIDQNRELKNYSTKKCSDRKKYEITIQM